MAVCSFGDSQPILVYKWNEDRPEISRPVRALYSLVVLTMLQLQPTPPAQAPPKERAISRFRGRFSSMPAVNKDAAPVEASRGEGETGKDEKMDAPILTQAADGKEERTFAKLKDADSDNRPTSAVSEKPMDSGKGKEPMPRKEPESTAPTPEVRHRSRSVDAAAKVAPVVVPPPPPQAAPEQPPMASERRSSATRKRVTSLPPRPPPPKTDAPTNIPAVASTTQETALAVTHRPSSAPPVPVSKLPGRSEALSPSKMVSFEPPPAAVSIPPVAPSSSPIPELQPGSTNVASVSADSITAASNSPKTHERRPSGRERRRERLSTSVPPPDLPKA